MPACDLSGGKLTIGTKNNFSVGIIDPSSMAVGKHYMLSSGGSTERLLPGLFYSGTNLYGAYWNSNRMYVFTMDTSNNA